MKIEDYLNQELRYVPGVQSIFIHTPEGDKALLDIRGWGNIQYMFPTTEEAFKFQDEIGHFIVRAIKEKIENDSLQGKGCRPSE